MTFFDPPFYIREQIMKNSFAFLVIGLLSLLIYFTILSDHLGHAPDIIVKNTQGKAFHLSRPNKPILVTFWATSCPICLKEMPNLAKLKYALGDRFELIAISMQEDPSEHVTQFIKTHHYPFIFVMDSKGVLANAFDNALIPPTYFLISPKGEIEYQMIDKLNIEYISERIKALSPQQ